MDLESIFTLMECFERSTLTGLELEQNGTRLKLDKTLTAAATTAAAPISVQTIVPEVPAAVPAAQTNENEGEDIKAPLVGTFYSSANPEAAPFVKVGDTVKKGQTVCILEAMKMMSEIPAPMDCVIEEVLVENGSLASFDAPLFRVRRL